MVAAVIVVARRPVAAIGAAHRPVADSAVRLAVVDSMAVAVEPRTVVVALPTEVVAAVPMVADRTVAGTTNRKLSLLRCELMESTPARSFFCSELRAATKPPRDFPS